MKIRTSGLGRTIITYCCPLSPLQAPLKINFIVFRVKLGEKSKWESKMSWLRRGVGKMVMIRDCSQTEIRILPGVSRLYYHPANTSSPFCNSINPSVASYCSIPKSPWILPSSTSVVRINNSSWGFGRHISSMRMGKKLENLASSAFSTYRQAIGLQLEGFLQRNSTLIYGSAGLVFCLFLWRSMFWIASLSLGVSEGMAKYGFAAFSSAVVAFAGLYVRSRFVINPNKVYRMAMRKLNTSAGILEVMGAPLMGTDLRAYVVSGGGFTFKNLRPALRPKRCFLIFPVQGSERNGLVSVVVKQKNGKYHLKLLAVDIPTGGEREQRFFIDGDDKEYNVGGGLISELRDSLVKTVAARKEFDDIDQVEEQGEVSRVHSESVK